METFLFSKSVDQSLLKSGLTVPKEVCEKMQTSLGVMLEKGNQRNISVKIDDKSFEAKFVNVNFAETTTDRIVFQIRYSSQSEICLYLKRKYQRIAEFIANHNSDDKLIIPSEMQETIDVFVIDGGMLEFKEKSKKSKALELFYKYLGPVNSLGGYERSYKLVLYKVLFEIIRNGIPTTTEKIAELFRNFYIGRVQHGLVPDINVSRAIADPENSSIKDVLEVILKNPYNVIHQKGFMTIENEDGIESFQLVPELRNALDDLEIDKILDIVEQKLKLYYSSMDNGADGKLREVIEKFVNGYIEAKKSAFSGSPFGTFVRSEIPNAIYNTGLVDPQGYLITGSVGQGNWATIPWICIFDRSITTSATKGVYIVYLLAKDGKTLYLTFNQGCTDIRNNHSKRETIKIMRERADEIIERIDSRGYATDENINLGDRLTELGEMYQKGTIFYTKYEQGNVPSEKDLQSDLIKMMDIYS